MSLELEPCHDRPRPRRGCRETRRASRGGVGIAATYGCRADVSETASGVVAVGIPGLRGEGVANRRHIHPRAIEDICEFGPKHQADPLTHPESTRQTHVLTGPALLPEIAVMGIRGTKLTVRRILPCLRVQHERPSRIVTPAIDVQFLVGMRLAILIHPGRGEQ